jgi:hypothetical protein
MNYAPIVLFVYKRLDHLKHTIISLKKNVESKKSKLIIFSDGYKNEDEKKDIIIIRDYIKNIKGFKKIEIIERKKNLGLAKNIVKGINKIFKNHEEAIILEDDIVVSSTFLSYMNNNLEIYRKNFNVASIHGYCYPINFKNKKQEIFFLKGADCWGWATWKRAWKYYENHANKLIKKVEKKNQQKKFDFNFSYPYFDMLKLTEKINHSWAIKWYASAFVNEMYTLYPKKSYVRNIGNDGSGTNSEKVNKFFIKKLNTKKINKKIKIQEDFKAREEFEKFFKTIYQKKTFLNKFIEKLRI